MTPSTVDRLLITGGLLAAMVAAGCGTVSGTAVPAPTTTTTTTTPPAPTAADGTDYAACADGTCEVAVSGPVDIALGGSAGPGTFSVRTMHADGIDFEVSLAQSGGRGTLKGHCTLSFHPGGGGSSCSNKPGPPPTPKAGVLAVQMVGVTAGTAVLRLVSG
ncbi:hypothetical protein [Saccharothrix deserti]|uniref:hypothetical protein n=1 Tax=Saccharothrix deserti TaxID=2593674 RepID=UPI00131CA4F6|nr:hypothetical protein [Saccharothrix deserti]